MAADDVEPAFRRALGAPLGHQAGGVRLGLERDVQHLLGRRHLEIERLGDLWLGDFGLEPGHVGVANVAAILAQMRRYAVRARLDGEQSGAHRVRPLAAARVADGGDVIDVHAEADTASLHLSSPELASPRALLSSPRALLASPDDALDLADQSARPQSRR